MNKFVHTKSHTGSKFSKTSLGHMMDCSYASILQFFSAASVGDTERQIHNRIFGQFFTTLRKDSVANYASILALFKKR